MGGVFIIIKYPFNVLSLCLIDVSIIRDTYIYLMFISCYKHLCFFITNILCKVNIIQ